MTGEFECTEYLIPIELYEAKIKALVDALLLIDQQLTNEQESIDQKEAA